MAVKIRIRVIDGEADAWDMVFQALKPDGVYTTQTKGGDLRESVRDAYDKTQQEFEKRNPRLPDM